MKEIILISGKKQSGKSSLRNYIVGKRVVDSQKSWNTFNISTKGELMVPINKNQMSLLDLNNTYNGFAEYADQYIWPYAKNYSIANSLKYMCINMFGLDYTQCFGTDEEKETSTNIRWSDIKFFLPPRTVGQLRESNKIDEFLTGREFMENIGKLFRNIYATSFVNDCIANILNDPYPYCVVDDVRYPNEVEAFLELSRTFDNIKVHTIRLLRNPYNSSAEAETALDGYPDSVWDFMLDNSEMEIKEKNFLVDKFLTKNKWI